jgi:pimeloyl-[acyl-carrier protein] methyl ester esterase
MDELHIASHGKGPDLVLLHGWGMHGGIWQNVVENLADDFRIHVVDLPGYGESAPVEPYTLEEVTGRIAAHLPYGAIVCGWSLGGQVAIKLALEYAGLACALILVASTPRFVMGDHWRHGISEKILTEFSENLEQDYEGTLKRFLSLQARTGDDARQVMTMLRSQLFARGRPESEILQGGLHILLNSDLRRDVRMLEQRTLLVHGNHDTLVPPGAAEWMSEQLPHADLHVVNGSAHAPFLSHQNEFVKAVKKFLT